jgi:hypothetical protein
MPAEGVCAAWKMKRAFGSPKMAARIEFYAIPGAASMGNAPCFTSISRRRRVAPCSGASAHPRRGEAHCGEHRQAAGPAAAILTRLGSARVA